MIFEAAVRGGEPKSIGEIFDETPYFRKISNVARVGNAFDLFYKLTEGLSFDDLTRPVHLLLEKAGTDVVTFYEYVELLKEEALDQARRGETPGIRNMDDILKRLCDDNLLPPELRRYRRVDL